MKIDKPIKESKKKYKLKFYNNDREAITSSVKELRTELDKTVYVYDLYDESRKLIALNRYCLKNSEKQPFIELTEEDELILNPPIVDEPMEMI